MYPPSASERHYRCNQVFMVSNLLGILRKRLSLRGIMANKYFGSVKGVRLEPQYMPRSLMYVGWGLGVRMPKQISSGLVCELCCCCC